MQTQTYFFSPSTQGMGALLNNSNGCPKMPIRNTTAIKAMSILGAEWRPCSKWRHYFCYPREDAAALVFLLLQPVVDFFLYLFSGSEGGCLGFEAGHICGGNETASRRYPFEWRLSACSKVKHTLVETELGGKLPRQLCNNATVPLPQPPPS